MTKEFIPYSEALVLKELGFNEKCFGTYSSGGTLEIWNFPHWKQNNIPYFTAAPLYQQSFRWFREKYKLHSYVDPVIVEKAKSPIKYDYTILIEEGEEEEYNNLPYHTYEEAQLECLKQLIKIVKDGNKESNKG